MGRRERRRAGIAALLLVLAILPGCRRQEATATSGATTILVSHPLDSLVREEAAQYVSLYPQVQLSVTSLETREAIVELLNGGTSVIAIDRPLNDEERDVAAQAQLNLTVNAFAHDGLAVIVHRDNPVRQLTVASVRRIVTREATAWMAIPESHWDRAIDLTLSGVNSGPPELLQRTFFHLPRTPEPTSRVGTQEQALAYVAAHPGAVTFVSMTHLDRLTRDLRIVPVESTDSTEARTFVLPSQMNVYQSLYPFHYSLYLVIAESKAAVGAGFSTFVIKTVEGQKLVQKAGLVPVNIPNRVIQLNPE